MSVSTAAVQTTKVPTSTDWLRSRNWDLIWISLSVVLVAGPYLSYLGMIGLQTSLQPVANFFGTTVDDLARNLINAFVALLVGGPHMYATFTRTALDHRFARQHKRLLWSSLLIPVIVVSGALLNLSLLLTFFFFWASIHVLHQIVYIVELYNHKNQSNLRQSNLRQSNLRQSNLRQSNLRQSSLSRFSRLADYAVVLTALYPLAAWKIASGQFFIGANDLGSVVGEFIPTGMWMVWLAGGAFGTALALWIAKTLADQAQGRLNRPKTLFIALTVTAAFFVPALGNLDTAFQGMNVWHSLQYLALTWMLNRLRQQRGELEESPFVERLSDEGSARRFYLFNISLTIADVVLAGVIFVILLNTLGKPFDYAFDRAYYIAVLSFLWIHYYHDHYLFTKPQVIQSGG